MSERIKVASSGDYFEKNGKPFFLLADTVWTALYNPTDTEWDYYLSYRRSQGYNAVQIASMTMWDGGKSDLDIYPVARDNAGNFIFSQINTQYFDHARKRLQKVVDNGMVPMIILLHACYAAGTWAQKRNPGMTIPEPLLTPILTTIVDAFREFHPMYIVAGDTDLKNEITKRYFWTALRIAKESDPLSLTCFHLTPESELEEEYVLSDLLDFYLLQSGHRGDTQSLAHSMVSHYVRDLPKRPIVNGEFAYEGHSHTQELYGRYGAFDQRRAIWQSLLSGGKAGIGYGAQGLWGWYRDGKQFRNSEYGGQGYPWQTALHFEGAWEGSFARYIWEQYDLSDIAPMCRVRNNHPKQREEIRAAGTEGKILIYVPYGTDVLLEGDFSGYSFTSIEMTHKYIGRIDAAHADGLSTLSMPAQNSDYLYIGRRGRD